MRLTSFSMASLVTAVVTSIVSSTEFLSLFFRNLLSGDSSSRPVLSNDFSARLSGYSWRIASTAARVKGDVSVGEAIVKQRWCR